MKPIISALTPAPRSHCRLASSGFRPRPRRRLRSMTRQNTRSVARAATSAMPRPISPKVPRASSGTMATPMAYMTSAVASNTATYVNTAASTRMTTRSPPGRATRIGAILRKLNQNSTGSLHNARANRSILCAAPDCTRCSTERTTQIAQRSETHATAPRGTRRGSDARGHRSRARFCRQFFDQQRSDQQQPLSLQCERDPDRERQAGLQRHTFIHYHGESHRQLQQELHVQRRHLHRGGERELLALIRARFAPAPGSPKAGGFFLYISPRWTLAL